MSVSTAVFLIASLVAVGALAKPLAEKLQLPVSIIHALAGLVLGLLGGLAVSHPGTGIPAGVAALLADLPVSSALFLHVLLPALLFQGALSVDIHRLREDLLPIVLLAVIAVLVAIVGIGLALWPFAGVPLVAVLLLASIVATTDPVAVISIFRSVGAPERLTRLVEGESLFNDAAAVACYLAFTKLLVAPGALDGREIAADLLLLPLGGACVGYLLACLVLHAPRVLREDRVSFAALTIAVPYLAFWAAEIVLGVSGVLAVVASGLTLATLAPGRIPPATWRYSIDVWELLGASATILVFILTFVLVPRLMAGSDLHDLVLLGILFIAALAARAAILIGLFPLLTRLGFMPQVPMAFRIVALWGGLRGSMTLVLALAVTENEAILPPVRVFVATLATGFTLATLFVQGVTLRPLIKRLNLDQLSEVDRTARDLALAATRSRTAELTRSMLARLHNPVAHAEGPPAGSLREHEAGTPARTDKMATGLVATTAREREIVLERFDSGILAPRLARRLLSESRHRLDLCRIAAVRGYDQANAEEVAFTSADRMAVWFQRRTGASRPLARRLAFRFETFLETSLVVDALRPFMESDLGPVLGSAVADAVCNLIADREAILRREIAALKLQYPTYAAELERLIVARAAHAQETEDVVRMRRTGLVNTDVERDLLRDLRHRADADRDLPTLDLGLDTRTLIDACSLVAALPAEAKTDLVPLLRPFYATPGTRIITAGEPGNAAFFISSGAVEVNTGASIRRLGRGDVFGEMALLYDIRRQADVSAIAYSVMLRLSAADFRHFLDGHPSIRDQVADIGRRRLEENAAARAQSPTAAT